MLAARRFFPALPYLWQFLWHIYMPHAFYATCYYDIIDMAFGQTETFTQIKERKLRCIITHCWVKELSFANTLYKKRRSFIKQCVRVTHCWINNGQAWFVAHHWVNDSHAHCWVLTVVSCTLLTKWVNDCRDGNFSHIKCRNFIAPT